MAASANPPAGGHSSGGGPLKANGGGGGASATENSGVVATQGGMRHNPGISLDWTPEEQSTLEELLAKYATETTIARYAKIAQALRDKTVRDVALRCRWMSKKENGKRRKDDNSSSRKNKDKKEKVVDPLPNLPHVPNRTNGLPYAQSMISTDSDDGIPSNAIGGSTGQLLEHNAQALDQINVNFCANKVQLRENVGLFSQARANIISILNDSSDLPELMKQMPPLPVKLNEELVNLVFNRVSRLKKS